MSYFAIVGKAKSQTNTSESNSEKVNDVYVIATDEKARKRLEKFAQVQEVQAIDMTRVAQLQRSDSHEQNELNNDRDYEPALISAPPGRQTAYYDPDSTTPRAMKTNSLEQLNELSSNRNNPPWSNHASYPANVNVDLSFSKNLDKNYNSYNGSLDRLNYNNGISKDDVNIVIDENGPHREMAIDCPDDFMGSIKSAPRYSGSAPGSNQGSLIKKSKETSQEIALTEEQHERLKQHQEDLRKRREEEVRQQKEDEFLRSSVRGSKKLRELESVKAVQGFVNTAFDEKIPEVSFDAPPGDGAAPSQQTIGVRDILSSLEYLQQNASESEEDAADISYLTSVFSDKTFQNAVSLHQKLQEVVARPNSLIPCSSRLTDLLAEVIGDQLEGDSPADIELKKIFASLHMRNLFDVHDQIAGKNDERRSDENESNYAHMSNIPLRHYDNEETIKIVHIEKLPQEPLGATVRNDGESVVIGRIIKGGAADKSGLLQEGDEILEVNGIHMRCMSIDDVSDRLAQMSGLLTFMIVPSNTEPVAPNDQITHIRAHFNYHPSEDEYIPCQELGLAFSKGDILHVINQDDPRWWQAYRDGDDMNDGLAGLIPSKNFQHQRGDLQLSIMADNKDSGKKGKRCVCLNIGKKKPDLFSDDPSNMEEILTYEEVEKYYPQPNRKRPIVLVGPQNVGRHELRQRLMLCGDRFAAAVPHTSRAPMTTEIDGQDYHFLPHTSFMSDIKLGKFVEYGEYDKNLYGTSINAVREVVNSGKICILNLHPESLRTLRSSDLKPYVIFVSSPNLDKLRQIRMKLDNSVPSDEVLKATIDKAREIEETFGHLFDYFLTNVDMDQAYRELVDEINRLEVEPQWVPRPWIDISNNIQYNNSIM